MKRSAVVTLLVGAIALVAIVVSVLSPVHPEKATAASGSNFDAGFIISDDTFYNANVYSVAQIQSFLSAKGASCVANSLPCLKDFSTSYAARTADSYCQGLAAATNASAAAIFAAVGTSCSINPQVLIVLVEKEQSLVSRTSPSDSAYRYATGFACPDSPPGCDTAQSGFVTQVYLAARQFQIYRINPGSFNYKAGQNNNILYSPNAACGSSAVFIKNQATAGLYDYTPYQPNAAALANINGTGDACSSYGNRNFWRLFTDWFGNPANLLSSASFEASVNSWAFVNGPLARQLVGPTNDAQSGQYFVAMYTPSPNLSMSQDAFIAPKVGQSYTGSIWVRSGTPGIPFTGTLALWGLGGTTEAAQTRFTVGDAWTQISATLPITKSGHNVLRFEVYLQSTNALLDLDTTSLSSDLSQPIRNSVEMQSPSFEAGIADWDFKNGFANRQIYNFGTAGAEDGDWVLAANTDTPGRSVGQDVPIDALQGQSYTASIWVRASPGAQTFKGTLALWGIGPSAQAGATDFTVGTSWTQITTTMTISQGSISMLRMELYMDSTTGDIYVDNASITPNLLPNPSFEAGVSNWNTGLTTNALDAVSQASGSLPDGRSYAATKASLTGSVATDIKRQLTVGETYTASVWLKSAQPGSTWTGTLALWGLGGTSEAATLPVSVGDTWTLVTVQLPVSQAAHSSLRLELYSGSPGAIVDIDGARVD